MRSPGSQKSKADLTREALDRLLHWLDRDRDRAGQRYEQIRSGLIKVFLCRGAVDPEELADETINRVARKSGKLLITTSAIPRYTSTA